MSKSLTISKYDVKLLMALTRYHQSHRAMTEEQGGTSHQLHLQDDDAVRLLLLSKLLNFGS